MSEECTHDCSTCSQNCSSKQEDFREKLNDKSKVRKVIGVVSGKGGVGKSLVTCLLASEMTKRGKRCAILDADLTGPSVPKAFGINERATGCDDGLFPVQSKNGIQIMSLNLLLENETDPVVWRGPVIAGTVKQFWSEVIWNDVDFMFVDMPPGTGDVPLTVFQSLPLDGIVVVSSPQKLVSMIVEKAVNMARMMDIPVIGLVENMSYFVCPDCGKKHYIFGESELTKTAKRFDISATSEIPFDSKLTNAVDSGKIEEYDADFIKDILNKIEAL